MRKPTHICDLEECGKTLADLAAFRRQLESFRITVCWNTSIGIWILGKVARPGAIGPDFYSLKVSTPTLADMMNDARQVARDFEGMQRLAIEEEQSRRDYADLVRHGEDGAA